MATPFVTVLELKERLRPLIDQNEDGAVVFDADGTLWRHDVGCMVYDFAVAEGAFREAAHHPLVDEASRNGLDIEGHTANDVARALQEAWYGHRYNGRAAAEMQVWAYVDFSEEEFRELTRAALTRGGHLDTLHEGVVELAAWVREQGRRACIVSASPRWVIEEASRSLGFESKDIAAGTPNTESIDGTVRVRPGLRHPLPYGPDKVTAGRVLLGDSAWLAALGDSSFDLDMMRFAQLGVGIGGKEAMLAGLAQIPHGLRLQAN